MDPQIIAFFCLTIVSCSLCCNDVRELMESGDAFEVFYPNISLAPRCDIVDLSYITKYYSQNGSEILGAGNHMRIHIFDENIDLRLHPSEGMLFREDTPVYHARYSLGSTGNVKLERQHRAMKSFGLLEDPHNLASLVIGTDKSGKTRINGNIMSRGLTIAPLSDHAATEYWRKKRSIGNSDYDSSNSSLHIVVQTPEISPMKYVFNRTSHQKRSDRAASGEIPAVLYPELLLVVENGLYRAKGSDTNATLKYLMAFWNSVDLLYRSLENPKIRLNIAGVIIGLDANATPYISNISNQFENSRDFNAYLAVNEATTFFPSIKDQLPYGSYDAAITLTTKTFGVPDVNGQPSPFLGIALRVGICTRAPEYTHGIAIVQDTGNFHHIWVAAHEVGHLLGMLHDGETFGCSYDDNRIMKPNIPTGLNSTSFSACSVGQLDYYIQTGQLTCLYNKPAESDYGLLRIMPATMENLNARCIGLGYQHTCNDRRNDECGTLQCQSNSRENTSCTAVSTVPVLDGSRCQSKPNGRCLLGRCIAIPVYTDAERKNIFAHTNWIDRGTT